MAIVLLSEGYGLVKMTVSVCQDKDMAKGRFCAQTEKIVIILLRFSCKN